MKLEGNTDERGTREYNIGLGRAPRAGGAPRLMLQGVAESQLTTVSFGAERPAVEGDDEAAWAQESPRGNGLHAVRFARIVAWARLCLAALALAGCAATPPEEDPVQIKLNDLDARLARIERVVANQSLLDLANQERGAAQRSARHAQRRRHCQRLEASRKQQRDLYADLDRRMKSLEARGGSAASGAAGAAPRRAAAASRRGGRRRAAAADAPATATTRLRIRRRSSC